MKVFSRLFDTFLSTLKGIDNEGSSKRATLYWIAGPIWGFVNVAVFLFHNKFALPADLPGTVALYDFLLICGLAGLTVYERIKSPLDNKNSE